MPLTLALALLELAPRNAASESLAPEAPGAVADTDGQPRANRLAHESSPYLLQHAHNPVDWYPWGEEALARARAENKLIFLSIGYSTCLWCHVMEREVFADRETAANLNATFIAIKVDREERPDLDKIYMAVRLMTAGRGGWPLSVLLTPDLAPLFAGGYIPNAQFRDLLDRAHAGWRTEEARFRRHAARLARAVEQSSRLPGEFASYDLPDRGVILQATERFAERYDREFAGFGATVKFPQPAILEMLMAASESGRHPAALTIAVETLAAMARGGIYDHLGGGFHRYATDRRWLIPHFEKMLYDNAELLHAYARAYSLTGNQMFRRVSEGIAEFVRREMTDATGLFYSALDSETGGQEGAYYVWSQEELRALLSAEDLALFGRIFGVAPVPRSAGKLVLHRAIDAPDEDADATRRGARLWQTLRDARQERPRPFRDDKVIAAWNGLMIEALAYSGRIFALKNYVRRAERAARALLATLIDESGGLLHVARRGEAKIGAYLDDYAGVILGLTELYRATGNAYWRGTAERLADRMIGRLYDEESGGFFDVSPAVAHLIVRTKDSQDGAMPAGNSLATRALHGLVTMGLSRFAVRVRHVLSFFAPTLAERPTTLPYMLWAMEEHYRHAAALPGDTATPTQTANVVRVAARIASGTAGTSARRLLVALEVDDGWHVNANPASFDYLIPTTVTAGALGNGLDLEPNYPSGRKLQTPLGAIAVYDRATEIAAPLPAALAGDGRPASIELEVLVQACNDDGVCLLPDTIGLTVGY